MELRETIKENVKNARMMQLATTKDNQPWNCTIYFVADAYCNLFWISKPQARHSKEIQDNANVAVAIPVKYDDLTVIGLSIEGKAMLVEDPEEIKEKVKLYSDKFKRGDAWYKEFIAGKNPHKLYRLKPTKFVLFDTVNSPKQERQELTKY